MLNQCQRNYIFRNSHTPRRYTMKRITTTIIICLCTLLLCGCGAGSEWIAAGTEDMPIAVFRSWINSAGELSTVKTYEYKLADGGKVKQAEKEQMQGVEAEELPLTVSQFAKVYEDVREWARTPGNMEETVNPGLSISFINARYAYSGELDFGELTYVYSLSTRKITPLEGEYTGEKAYGMISGGYPMTFIFIDE